MHRSTFGFLRLIKHLLRLYYGFIKILLGICGSRGLQGLLGGVQVVLVVENHRRTIDSVLAHG